MENESRITRDYELMSILVPDMAEEETQAAIERVNGYISGAGAESTETLTDSPWGRRRLSYSIRHENVDYRDGYYVVSHFTAMPATIAEIERELKLDTGVIRYLLVMDDPKAGEKVTAQPESAEATAEEPAAAGAAPAEATTEEAASADTTAADAAPAEAEDDVAESAPSDTAEPLPNEPVQIEATDNAPAEMVADASVEDEVGQTAAEETAVDAPASGTAEATAIDSPDADAVEEVADVIQGEENPDPADGAENNRTEV